ncbi:MAG: hydrolase [Pseudooceanicola sp.]|nr:hydrolase [Pseudooceanicola sp.]
MGPFDLVIFDCDGVLIDSELISARQLVATLARFGVQIDLPYVAKHFLGRSYGVVLSQIRGDFGIDLPEGFEATYRETLLAAFARDLKAMPGVRETVTRLAVPYCLATSSSPPRVERSLQITGLTDLFAGRITTAAEVRTGKPAPDLFLLAAQKHGATPARCLVIEDSAMGIRAGLAAGMTVLRFTGGGHLAGAPADAPGAHEAHGTFASFADFFHLVPQLERRPAR